MKFYISTIRYDTIRYGMFYVRSRADAMTSWI